MGGLAGEAVPDRVRHGPRLEEMVSVPSPREGALLSEERFHGGFGGTPGAGTEWLSDHSTWGLVLQEGRPWREGAQGTSGAAGSRPQACSGF